MITLSLLLAGATAGLVAVLASPRSTTVRIRVFSAFAAVVIAVPSAQILDADRMIAHLFPWIVLPLGAWIGWCAPAIVADYDQPQQM